MNPEQQNIQVVGTRIILAGERANMIAERHQEKLKKHPLDCGVDIFPHHIREMKKEDVEVTAAAAELKPEDTPPYDVLALNDHQNLIYIHTALNWVSGPNTFSLLTERSSSIEKLNGGRVVQGIIDANYTGEIIVRVLAMTSVLDEVIGGIEMCIEEGLAVAQMIPLGFFYPGFEMHTASGIVIPMGQGRGTNGFGSTDKR